MTTAHTHTFSGPHIRRRTLMAAGAASVLVPPVLAHATPAQAVTTGNGSLVFSPAAGSSFNPEGGRPAGTTYAKNIVLKHNGSHNDDQLVTFDQLVLVNDVQVYPIHRSTDAGKTWEHVTDIVPSHEFADLTRTSQPHLYEVPIDTGDLKEGALLFAGMIMPEDRSSSRLVLYVSTDHGNNWTYRSTIDEGGPATYDPSPESSTSTVWEPSLAIDADGGLVAYFSDERQKNDGVLQAVSYRRSTDGGHTWGELHNVSAPTNRSDRPGMITVTRIPDGRYVAAFEVVNRPSQDNNTAPVYFKFSPDGLDWSPEESVGDPVELEDGRGIGSSPFVRWVPMDTENGAIIVASKWCLDANGNSDGGQNFYINRNLGDGPWERLPMAVTYDATDSEGGTFSGFAQSFDVSSDGKTLFQASNVENLDTTYNDIRVGLLVLDAAEYEAEDAHLSSDVRLVAHVDATGGKKVGDINTSSSEVSFTVNVQDAGDYFMDVRYDNGTGETSSHGLSVNGNSGGDISYPATRNWGRYGWAQGEISLKAGDNTVTFTHSKGFAELDCVRVHQ
jgi:hypothetical protein